jgi:hypothetical protein
MFARRSLLIVATRNTLIAGCFLLALAAVMLGQQAGDAQWPDAPTAVVQPRATASASVERGGVSPESLLDTGRGGRGISCGGRPDLLAH